MKSILLTLLLIAPFVAAQTNVRATYNFNSDWKLLVGDPAGAESANFDDTSWKGITLPRAWNEDDAFRKDIKDLATGIGVSSKLLVQRTFHLPAALECELEPFGIGW